MRGLKNTPHLFAKLTIVYCILFASGASVWALWRQGQGFAMTDVLAVVLGFFGGELLLLCLKTVLGKEKGKNENSSDESGV